MKETVDFIVFDIVSKMPPKTEFRGRELKEMLVRRRPESAHCYVDSVLRVLRRTCKGLYEVVGPAKGSLYRRL